MDKRYTCKDVAEIYGVALITVWDWIRSGKLPAFKIGKQYYIRPEDLAAMENSRL